MRSFAAVFFVVLAIVLLNVYREHGVYGVRSWLRAKVVNDPLPRRVPARTVRRAVRRARDLPVDPPVGFEVVR